MDEETIDVTNQCVAHTHCSENQRRKGSPMTPTTGTARPKA
ncbi:hypothetical protein RESH_05395 [Rhodopirellula europaea SH398]|uniref:Uncharacterized protein n=1 Tax=Rhodopirellula europaea SH398 TaxID=1263868 RepID=M5RXJ2_9BACT|nr:hypothetical protein RESH_05395 [Rhodopirellula europaea SH398]